MIREVGIAVVLAGLLVGILSMTGFLPLGMEPLDAPWRITVTLIVGMVIGTSVGFVWLDQIQKETAFPWQLLTVTFVTAGICAIEYLYCLENFETCYSLPVLAAGGVSVGSFLGGLARTL